jgi:hypothetical protein
MTSAHVRSTVTAYYRIRGLLAEPLPEDLQACLAETLARIENDCRLVTGNSAPSRWARSIVGTVLTAGLGACCYMRGEIANPSALLRVFGLVGEHALSSQAAWNLVKPYAWEPVIGDGTLAELRRRSSLRLHRLPADPGPADVLLEMTRPRSGAFAVHLARWLAEYFREHAGPQHATTYADHYRATLADLITANERGEMAYLTGQVSGSLTRDEWGELIRGRVPPSRLELRAGYLTTRQFLVDLWRQWNPEKQEVRLAAG